MDKGIVTQEPLLQVSFARRAARTPRPAATGPEGAYIYRRAGGGIRSEFGLMPVQSEMLYQWRRRWSINQVRLAEQIGIDQQALSNLERDGWCNKALAQGIARAMNTLMAQRGRHDEVYSWQDIVVPEEHVAAAS